MNKKLIALGTTALVLGGLIATPKLAEAYQGDLNAQNPDCIDETHEAMEQAFENNDYYAWRELMNGKGRVTEVITEENFAQFAEAHKLEEEGKTDEANVIRQELGLGLRNGSGNGNGSDQGNRQGFDQSRNS